MVEEGRSQSPSLPSPLVNSKPLVCPAPPRGGVDLALKVETLGQARWGGWLQRGWNEPRPCSQETVRLLIPPAKLSGGRGTAFPQKRTKCCDRPLLGQADP